MKETANGLPYPEDTDAPNGPAQIKALAEAIDQIPSALIADLAVIESKLGNASVATAKLIDLAVTTVKLANEAVTEAKLGNLAVATAKLANLAVTAGKLANESVETGKLQALAVTTAKLAGESVTAAKLAANAVEEAKIKDKAVTSRKAKLTAGIEPATGNLTLTGAFQDVPGASLAITPAVASLLLVTAVFDLEVHSEGPQVYAVGGLNVDGEDEEETAVTGILPPGNNIIIRQTVSQVYAIPLTAAAHTIKLRAKREGSVAASNNTCIEDNTRFLYELIAS